MSHKLSDNHGLITGGYVVMEKPLGEKSTTLYNFRIAQFILAATESSYDTKATTGNQNLNAVVLICRTATNERNGRSLPPA